MTRVGSSAWNFSRDGQSFLDESEVAKNSGEEGGVRIGKEGVGDQGFKSMTEVVQLNQKDFIFIFISEEEMEGREEMGRGRAKNATRLTS